MTIQFKKGVLELCVLSMLKQDDQYGYDVASKLSQSIQVADGSIYLVLRRLKQEEFVTSYLEEASGGPPRKYYVITRKGERLLDELVDEWRMLVDNVNGIVAGDMSSTLQRIVSADTVAEPEDASSIISGVCGEDYEQNQRLATDTEEEDVPDSEWKDNMNGGIIDE